MGIPFGPAPAGTGAGGSGGGAPDAHASSHITSGSDEIDGDKIDIDWNPSNYTPATTPTEVDSVDNLTAHLYGIDQALAAAADTLQNSYNGGQVIVYNGTNTVDIQDDGTGATSDTVLLLSNNTASSAGAVVQYSPGLTFLSSGWDGAESWAHYHKWLADPIDNTAYSSSALTLYARTVSATEGDSGYAPALTLHAPLGENGNNASRVLWIREAVGTGTHGAGLLMEVSSITTPNNNVLGWTLGPYPNTSTSAAATNFTGLFLESTGMSIAYDDTTVEQLTTTFHKFLLPIQPYTNLSTSYTLGTSSAIWGIGYIGAMYATTTAVQNLNSGDYSVAATDRYVLLANTGGAANQAVFPSSPSDGRVITEINTDLARVTQIERGGTNTIGMDALTTHNIPPNSHESFVFDNSAGKWLRSSGCRNNFGCIYAAGTTHTQSTNAAAGKFDVITAWDADGILYNVTSDKTTYYSLTVAETGVYIVSFSVSFIGQVASSPDYTIKVWKNPSATTDVAAGTGSALAETRIMRGTTTVVIGDCASSPPVLLTAGDVLSLVVASTVNGSTFNVQAGYLAVHSLN